jgi:hypothetical protein
MNEQAVQLLPEVAAILSNFRRRSGFEGVDYEVKQRAETQALVLQMANPTERFFRVLQEAKSEVGREDAPTVTIEKRTPRSRLQSAEARYFLQTLSESLNISRFSFKEDFFARYTKSVSNAEAQITAAANHIVFGRRGAGKSSLLLYAMRSRDAEAQPSAWIDMQVYERRNDNRVVLDIFIDVLQQLEVLAVRSSAYTQVVSTIQRLRKETDLTDDQIRQFLPELRGLFATVVTQVKNLFIFLDDFHVIDVSIQATLLGFLYSVSRGNNLFLKLSAIETLTRSWNSKTHAGLQVPHDAQTIKLDYNLTMPDKAASHIEGILDAHAIYCGLPGVRFLCTSGDVLSRLVWVSAGVPRDALNLFAQAMTKGTTEGRSLVSVTNVNVAASEMVSQKLRDLEIDVPGRAIGGDLSSALESVKDFCIKKERKNAFLTEIRNDNAFYQNILKLVDLRLVHVISEGITVGEAGRKYVALILDYGFYTGIRAAQSVDLFNKQTERVAYKDLRKLPVLEPKLPSDAC